MSEASKVEIVDPEAEYGGAPALSPAEVAAARKQEADDKRLQKLGWRDIGVPEEGARLMESFESFVGGKIQRTIDATHGSMLRSVASAATRMVRIERQMEKIEEKYEAGGECAGSEMSGEDLAKIQLLHNQWKDCAKILKDCNGEATKAAHIRVMMMAKAVEQVNKKRNTKPAWKRAQPAAGAGARRAPGGPKA